MLLMVLEHSLMDGGTLSKGVSTWDVSDLALDFSEHSNCPLFVALCHVRACNGTVHVDCRPPLCDLLLEMAHHES